MAKYKKCDYNQTVLLPLALSDQLQPGTLEFYINMIVEEKIDLSVFDTKYNNDDNGSPAYPPTILLIAPTGSYAPHGIAIRTCLSLGILLLGVGRPTVKHPRIAPTSAHAGAASLPAGNRSFQGHDRKPDSASCEMRKAD